MTEDQNKQVESALDRISVAPPEPEEKFASERKDAGTDESIHERLERDPESKQARLDRALDESMDASDPPATTQPIHNHHPVDSSGYDAEAEKKLAERQD